MSDSLSFVITAAVVWITGSVTDRVNHPIPNKRLHATQFYNLSPVYDHSQSPHKVHAERALRRLANVHYKCSVICSENLSQAGEHDELMIICFDTIQPAEQLITALEDNDDINNYLRLVAELDKASDAIEEAFIHRWKFNQIMSYYHGGLVQSSGSRDVDDAALAQLLNEVNNPYFDYNAGNMRR